jgi:hypothetical protein
MRFSILSEAQINYEPSHRPTDGGSAIWPGVPDYDHYTQLLTKGITGENSERKKYPMWPRMVAKLPRAGISRSPADRSQGWGYPAVKYIPVDFSLQQFMLPSFAARESI